MTRKRRVFGAAFKARIAPVIGTRADGGYILACIGFASSAPTVPARGVGPTTGAPLLSSKATGSSLWGAAHRGK